MPESIKNKNKIYYDQRFGTSTIHPSELNTEESFRLKKITGVIEKLKTEHFNNNEIQILDFGCGRGWLSKELTLYGKVTAVDLSSESVKTAASFYPEVNFICLDATDSISNQLTFQSFDLIVSSEVIEHIEDQDQYLKNIWQLLKPGGYLLLTTPNGAWKKHHFYLDRVSWQQPLEAWLTTEQLFELLNHRFSDIQISTFNASWIFDYRSFGLPSLLALPLWRRVLRTLHLKDYYLNLLSSKGFGLYLLVTARKPE